MKAYLLIRTRYVTSKELIDDIRKYSEDCFIHGESTYGWYDAIVELDVSSENQLDELRNGLVHSQIDIVHLGTAMTRNDNS